MLHLPVGINTLDKILSGGFVYVDKTEHVHRIVEKPGQFFLSRPRRFGKSLFLDTLKELFEGNEKLFQGLHIHDNQERLNRGFQILDSLLQFFRETSKGRQAGQG